MGMYQVSVSGDDVDAAPDPNVATPLVFFYEIEADGPHEAVRQAVSKWQADGAGDEPRSITVTRAD
jgi:hypothetical protein